jgi:hypothetical protein
MRRSKGGRGERLSSSKNTRKGKGNDTRGTGCAAPTLATIYAIDAVVADEVMLSEHLGWGGRSPPSHLCEATWGSLDLTHKLPRHPATDASARHSPHPPSPNSFQPRVLSLSYLMENWWKSRWTRSSLNCPLLGKLSTDANLSRKHIITSLSIRSSSCCRTCRSPSSPTVPSLPLRRR